MSTVRGGTGRERLAREAIDWYLENESDRVADHARLAQWMKWSTRAEHRKAYAEVVQMQQDLRNLPQRSQIALDELLEDAADDPDVVIVRGSSCADPVNREGEDCQPMLSDYSRSGFGLRGWIAVVGAACVAFAALLLLSAYWRSPLAQRTFVTAAGEQRTVALEDQSTVRLGGDTRLTVRYTERARVIELAHGEALFRVRHDPNRPFVVRSDGGTTTAVGTEFEVRKYANHVQVWVREGAVIVAPLTKVELDNGAVADIAPAGIPVRLSEGQVVSYDGRGQPDTPQRADPHMTAAWAPGNLVPLVYRTRPLQEVIEDIQPYTRRTIVVDPQAAGLFYTGIVKQEDVEAWIRDLSSIYPVDVIDCRLAPNPDQVTGCANPEHILIRRHESAAPDELRSASR